MRVVRSLDAIDPPLVQSVLTIGNFDGVHRGHQQLLAQAGLFAANTGGPVVVLTFEPHPLAVVAPTKVPARLSTLEQKLQLLDRAGADLVVVARSDPSLMNLEAEQFVADVVRDRFRPTHIVEGPSFGFGKGRRGTPELLVNLAKGFGCDVHILEPVTLTIAKDETMLVSSSLIRRLIGEGLVRRAALCLGRPFALWGHVVSGDKRGREIGFPTANLEPEDQLVPADGVYAGVARLGESSYDAAISIGSAPTFDGSTRRIEAHLLDFDGDLYGKSIELDFIRHIRPQQRFDSADALVEQLHKDVATVRSAKSSSTNEIQENRR